MKIHCNITVTGKVQGVWFRANTKDTALALGINGFVKNLDNGAVYIEAEGSEKQLNEFISWCKKGPLLAHVAQLTQESGELKHFSNFEIR